MVTGASTADLAVILIDARKGVLTQTRRHSFLAHLLGIRHIVLAVNKMDLVGYDKGVFDRITLAYRAEEMDLETLTAFTLSDRSEEHTSELQSLMRISYAVFCLKKKKIKYIMTITHKARTL